MRKLLLCLSFLILFPTLCFGAIGATCVFEMRTTGSNDNGGGYTSGGTDYSQQDAAQLTRTDLACTVASTTLTSATGGFTSAMIGNIIYIKSGTNFVVGWYEIAAYTDTNTVTIDRTACSGAGDASSGTGSVGGARALPIDAFFEALTAGNMVYIKAGTYTLTENINVANDGTYTNVITIEGYNSSRGDNPTGANRPLIAAGAYTTTFDEGWYIKNLQFTTTSAEGLLVDVWSVVENCYSYNSSETAAKKAFFIGYGGVYGVIIGSEGISTKGIACGLYTARAIGCYFHDSNTGVSLEASRNSIVNSIIDTCTTGINLTLRIDTLIIGNTIYNCTTGLSATTAYQTTVINNILDTNTTGASWTTEQKSNYFDYNAWGNNTTDVSNVTKGDYSITSAPPNSYLTADAATGDFTLPSGSACIDAGMQVGVNQGAVGDYKVNIGADQDDVTAAGDGGEHSYGFVN